MYEIIRTKLGSCWTLVIYKNPLITPVRRPLVKDQTTAQKKTLTCSKVFIDQH